MKTLIDRLGVITETFGMGCRPEKKNSSMPCGTARRFAPGQGGGAVLTWGGAETDA